MSLHGPSPGRGSPNPGNYRRGRARTLSTRIGKVRASLQCPVPRRLKPLASAVDPGGMLLVVVALLAVLTVPLTGGHLSRLTDVRFRAPGLALAGLGAQVLVVSVLPDLPGWLAITIHFASYAAVLGFVWLNRTSPACGS